MGKTRNYFEVLFLSETYRKVGKIRSVGNIGITRSIGIDGIIRIIGHLRNEVLVGNPA